MIGVTIEFAFGSTWLDDPAGLTWTDETDRGEAIPEVVRGRSSELELFSAGTAVIELDSAGRRFDPLNADGPHYGKLVPGVPVRITADGEPVFYGFVDGWDHAVGKFKGTVTVTATDAFKYLTRVRLPRTVYEREVRDDGPWLYWPLSESETVVAADLSGNRRDGAYSGRSLTQGADTLRPFADGSLEIAEDAAVAVTGKRNERITSGPIAIEAWLAPVMPELSSFILRMGSGSTNDGVSLQLNGPSRIALSVKYASAEGAIWQWPTSSTPKHVLIGWDGSAYRCFINGTEVPADFTSPWNPDTFDPRVVVGIDGPLAYEGRISDVAIYAAAPTAEMAARHYAAAISPWFGEHTGDRVNRILDLIGWPEALRAVDPGEVECGNADLAGMTALEYLQVLEQTEGGRLFIARDGKLTFHAAGRTITGPAGHTYDADNVEADSISFSMDDTFVFDGAEVQRKYGVVQTAGAEHPTQVYSATGLAMRDDAAARSRAERIVSRYKLPQVRAKTWRVQQPADLTAELGDVVELEVTPQDVGDPIALTLFREQIAYSFSPDDYHGTFYGSPVDDRDLFRFAGPNTVGAVNGFEAGVFR